MKHRSLVGRCVVVLGMGLASCSSVAINSHGAGGAAGTGAGGAAGDGAGASAGDINIGGAAGSGVNGGTAGSGDSGGAGGSAMGGSAGSSMGGTSACDTDCPGEWTREIGTELSDSWGYVAVDQAGNVYVAGSTAGVLPGETALGKTDLVLRKFDPQGNEIFTRQFGTNDSDRPNGLRVDPGGNVFLVGFTLGAFPGETNQGKADVVLLKLASDGSTLWTRQFGTPDGDIPYDIAVDSDGSVVVVGEVDEALPGQTYVGAPMAFVRKYSSGGEEQWTRQFGTGQTTDATAVTVDASGAVFVAGPVYGALPGQGSYGKADIYVRKYDASGVEGWTRQWGSTDGDFVYSVDVDPGGNIFLTGYIEPSTLRYTSFVYKLDSSGEEIWSKTIAGSMSVNAHRVVADSKGNVIVAGDATGTVDGGSGQVSGIRKGFVRRFDASGQGLSTRYIYSEKGDYVNSLALGSADAAVVAGYTYGDLEGQTNAGATDLFVTRLLP